MKFLFLKILILTAVLESCEIEENGSSIGIKGIFSICDLAKISYYQSGSFKRCEYNQNQENAFVVFVKDQPIHTAHFIELYESGSFKESGLHTDQFNEKPLVLYTPLTQFIWQPISSGGIIRFFENGHIKQIESWFNLAYGSLSFYMNPQGQKESVPEEPCPPDDADPENVCKRKTTVYPVSFTPDGWNTHVYCLNKGNTRSSAAKYGTVCYFKLAEGVNVWMDGYELSEEEKKHTFFYSIGNSNPEAATRIELYDHSGYPKAGKLACQSSNHCTYRLMDSNGEWRDVSSGTEVSLNSRGEVKVP